MVVPIVSESWCKEPKENEISLLCFVSGHPKLNVNLIKRYHELPDAKLTGRYSTPLLLHLWSQYIKQSVVTTTTEVEVLAPIAFGKSEMNKQNNTPKTGFRGNGSVTETLKNRVNKLSVMVPKEWRFSYFAELVNQNEINCDELEDFKVHMGKSMEYVKNALAPKGSAKKSSSTPGSGTSKSRSTPSEIRSFANMVRGAFSFVKKEKGMEEEEDEGEEEEDVEGISDKVLSEAFKEYKEAGLVRRVQFEYEKLVKFHEEKKNTPEKCGDGILALWEEYQNKIEEKKAAKKAESASKKKGKRKADEESPRTSPRKKSKFIPISVYVMNDR